MRLLVTGASGFLGRHVLRRLDQADVQLFALTRNSLPPDVTATVINGDVSSPLLDWEALGRPDVVLHLAWGGLPNYRSPHHYEEAHSHSLFLRRLVAQGLPRLVCAGTCFEYGMRDGCLSEDFSTDPANPYGLAKDMLRRQLMMDIPRERLLWTRFFYLYGEGQGEGSLYSQVQAAIARRDLVFPMSGGEQLRDFLPVATAVDYFVRLALAPHVTGIVNIASGQPVSIRRLVEKWFTGASHPVTLDLGHFPYPDWEPFAFWGSTARLAAALA